MFETESRPTLWRVGWRLYFAHTHTPIVEELELELALESADYGYKSANSSTDPTKIGVWVRAFNQAMLCLCCHFRGGRYGS